VNGERVRAMIGDVRRRVGQGQSVPLDLLWTLWRIMGIELWYRTIFVSPAWSPARITRASAMTRAVPSI
jgi:hypothetical protein